MLKNIVQVQFQPTIETTPPQPEGDSSTMVILAIAVLVKSTLVSAALLIKASKS